MRRGISAKKCSCQAFALQVVQRLISRIIAWRGLAEVMDRLSDGDRQLIRLRFFAGRTQSETARVLGTTQVQISRRERSILKWMREQLLEAL